MIYQKSNTGSSFDLNKSQDACCNDSVELCRYSYAMADDVTLTSIVVNGTVIALGGISVAGTTADVLTAILNKLSANGYSNDGYPSIKAWKGNDEITLDFYSSVTLGNLVTSAGTETTTSFCVKTPACYYEFTVDVSDALSFDLLFGELTGTTVGGTINDDYSSGSAGTLADDVLALFAAESYSGILLNARVEVTENVGEGIYTIGLWLHKPDNGKLYIDNGVISPVTCSPDYSKAS